MRTRLSALTVAIAAASVLTACGGGGGGPSDFAADPIPVEVTLTAPETVERGEQYRVAWESRGASSCAASFSSETSTDGQAFFTLTEAGSQIYSVTCTGPGGSATANTTVTVNANATAEGMWQGALQGQGRAISGVVTQEGSLWLAYSAVEDEAPAGFYAGEGTMGDDHAEDEVGNFDGPEAGLREFNFEGGGARQGTLVSTFTQSAGYTSANTLAGSFNTVSADPNTYDIMMSASNYFGGLSGLLVLENFTGTWNAVSGSGSWSGRAYSEADPSRPGLTPVPFDVTFTQTFTMQTTPYFDNNPAWGGDTSGYLNPFDVPTCVDAINANRSGCTGFSAPYSGWMLNTQGTTTNDYQTPLPFTPVDEGTYTWTLQIYKAVGQTFEYIPVAMNVSLASRALPSVTAATFTSNYNAVYEEAPSLDAIAGTYSAGWTGISTTMYPDASLTISSDGSVTGTEAASHCSYTATIAPHATGNVYDVTNIVFANAGGSCAYAGRTFAGVATLEAGKVTITAIDAPKKRGFMVVATMPQ